MALGTFLLGTITQLSLRFGEAFEVGTGTGFFLKLLDEWFLVTNWHVLAGRTPGSGQPIRADGAVPDRCVFKTVDFEGERLVWADHVFHLGDALVSTANWFQHPTEGQDIDIGCLPIGPSSRAFGQAKDLVSSADPNMFVDVGEELFLPGFPLGLSAGNFPIWKRASLASSTEFGFGIKRYIFVDTATREGMSGSPCLAIRNWRYRTLDRQSGKFGEADGPAVRLLGVYAGRLNPSDSFEAQIGMVWRENLIFDTISGRISATVRISG